jgi:hypothetical protein
MRGNVIRKILVVLIFITPLISYSGCKKQAACGCGKDVLYTLNDTPCYVYFSEAGAGITFLTLGDPYSTYNFCNPTEMFPKLADYKSGDILLVSGFVYWECNYVYQSSNYQYQSYYKVYMCEVTDVYKNLYGK